MKSPLDTKKIWKTLMSDPKFTKGATDGALEVFRDVVEALPKVLAEEQLNAKVTLATLTKAKLDIVEYMLDNDIVTRLAASIPADLTICEPDEMADFLKMAFEEMRTPFMEIIHNTKASLDSYGATERDVLADPKGCNLDRASLKAFDAGTLTIRRLLMTQPSTFLSIGE